MNSIMLKIIFTFYSFLVITCYPQSKDPDEILKNVINTFEKIEDYKVDVEIKVDVIFLKIPNRKAKIFFKQPDKIHVESEGFAVLPKQGISFSPAGFLGSSYTAIFEKETLLNGINVSVLKVIPLDEDSDVVLTTLWIDQQRNLIMKIESSRKPSGTYVIELAYKKINEVYILPDSMKISFSTENIFIPPGMAGEMENEKKEESENSEDSQTGRIFINYFNYKINKQLPDSIFIKKVD
jgi:hypothetical protein